MLKNEKIKFYFSVFIALALSGILAWFGVIEVKASIDDYFVEIRNKNIEIATYDLRGMSLSSSKDGYEFSKSKIDKFSGYFVYAGDNNNEEFFSFFEQLDNPVSGLGVRTGNKIFIELDQPASVAAKDKKDPGAKTEDFRLLKITLTGSFESLMNFVYSFEGLPYYAEIQSININSMGGDKSKDSAKDDLQSVLIIKVFKKQIQP